MMRCNYRFTSIPGYFIDNVVAASSCPGGKLTTRPSLGIIDQQYSQSEINDRSPWVRFSQHLDTLNRNSLAGESYKLVYLIRHGMSVHNLVMEQVGGEAWKSHWSHLEGNGTLTWLDAKLTADGISLAQDLGRLWVKWSTEAGVPPPETIYTSPLARCLETTKLAYQSLMTQLGKPLQPVVKELLRERLTNHTCDKRSTKSWIVENYPDYVLEPNFSEEDVLWRADAYESAEEHMARKQDLLEDIFANDDARVVSLTTHSYAISAILEVVGAQHFRVSEGAVVPLLIKAERVG